MAYVLGEGSVIDGVRLKPKMVERGTDMIEDGTCDAAVFSIFVGGAGLNAQSMNRIIFMDPPTSDVQQKQAKGNPRRYFH